MNRGWFLLTIGLVLLIIGMGAQNASVIALSLPPFAILAYSLLRETPAPELTVERDLSRRRFTVQDEFDVTIRVTNRGSTLIERAHIADVTPPGVDVVDGENDMLTRIEPGQTRAFSYRARAKRGEYTFGDIRVTTHGTLGLRQRISIENAPAAVLVEPIKLNLRDADLRPARTRGFTGPIPARVRGSGVDFLGLREYQQGDRLRTINWRATARAEARGTAALYANQFEQQRIADIGLILDARSAADIASPTETLFEHSVRATMSLSDALLRQGHRVGLMIYGAGVGMVYPGYGAQQRRKLVTALSRVRTGQHFVYEHLHNIPTRFFAPSSQIVYVGPCHKDDAAALAQLRARGYAVMAVCPDPLKFELHGHGIPANEAAQLGIRIARLERELALGSLKRIGVQVVDWDAEQPLESVLQRALRTQPTNRITRLNA